LGSFRNRRSFVFAQQFLFLLESLRNRVHYSRVGIYVDIHDAPKDLGCFTAGAHEFSIRVLFDSPKISDAEA
jgi:hypothetical protein